MSVSDRSPSSSAGEEIGSPSASERIVVHVVGGRSYDEVWARTTVPADRPVCLDQVLALARASVPELLPTNAMLVGPPGWRWDSNNEVGLPCVCLTQADDGSAAEEVIVEMRGLRRSPGSALMLEHPAPGITVMACRDGRATIHRAWVAVSRSGASATATAGLFRAFDDALRELAIPPRHVTRTWLYLDDIANSYDDLNAARDEYFDKWKLPLLPASTGIGATLDGATVTALLETTSVDGSNPACEVTASMQCSPTEYGPRFARANTWMMNGQQYLNVSGISSIDEHGRSLVSSDSSTTVEFAMSSAAELLQRAGGFTFADVTSARAYATPEVAADAFGHYRAAAEGLTPNCLEVTGRICRPELTFEFEATAIRTCCSQSSGIHVR
jgi:enamine deaminase RidA (YjgF/YER057c/UK114 family)